MYCICGVSERKREHGPMRMEESEKRKTSAHARRQCRKRNSSASAEGAKEAYEE
jgi:hypothetical protein